MGKVVQDNTEFFKEVVRNRIARYIATEVKDLVTKKIDEIVTDVLSSLKTEVNLYNDMLRAEANLVIKAFYNGTEIGEKNVNNK